MLDMTGPGGYDPHYRRYLNNEGRIVVVCVQDFDYPDYDASRFVDLASFGSEIEAETMPIDPLDAIVRANDRESAAQAFRIVRAILNHNGRP